MDLAKTTRTKHYFWKEIGGGGETIALIIYVDDMVVTRNDEEGISELQRYLASEFEMKDLGGLKYFLGIKV